MSHRLNVIIASTRPGRVGDPIGSWFHGFAREHGAFDAHLVDLADFALPLYDEPRHPILRQYEHEHTRRWSESVAAADAFVLVTPEYNSGPTPALVNALNYVYVEWTYKPAGFVSYGGVSGGLRAVQATKPILNTLKVVPMVEAVTIPAFSQHMNEGRFVPNELHLKGAGEMLDELSRWSEALRPLRADRATSKAA